MSRVIAAVLISLLCALPALADDKHHPGAGAFADGEVRKVDKDARKITLKHGPLQSLDMPAMTMVFRVKDAAMLEQLKPGDKVQFTAEQQGGALTVTKIVPAK